MIKHTTIECFIDTNGTPSRSTIFQRIKLMKTHISYLLFVSVCTSSITSALLYSLSKNNKSTVNNFVSSD